MKIGVIGLGRLGGALVRGWERAGLWEDVLGYNRSQAKAEALQKQARLLRLCCSPGEIFSQCDPVFLWTKPQDAAEILAAAKALLVERSPFLISCTRGVPLADYSSRWAESLPNVNMPAGRGVTLIHYGPGCGEAERATAQRLLGAVGSLHEVPQAAMALYSAVCSCGPALYATMLEILADTLAERHGFDREFCRALARETMAGTLLLQELDGADAAEVVARVAHPGGPSEAGVQVLRAELPGLFTEMLQRMRKW